MSKSIDERVVQMTFDNKSFERNVSTSLTTLKKLKSGLMFDKSTKSLANLNKTTKNVSFDGLARGVETISNRFTNMGIVGVTVIQNLTNSAMRAGKKIVSALTIDPVKAGFEEYEIKMNAIKTILSNTKGNGTTLDDINDALQDLNDYSDQTVYNFAQMTDMVGKFSAKTGDLEGSVSIVKGMANLAAQAGVGNQQLQNTLYQMSQISEKVTLMDWKSIENANLATISFRDDLFDMAKEMHVFDNIPGLLESIENGTLTFRDSISKGWMTKDVLNAVTDMYALDEAMTKSAGEVTTVTKLFIVMREIMQSGWTVSWEHIIGNKKQSTETLGAIREAFIALTAPAAKARNDALAYWNTFGGRDAMLMSMSNAFRFLFQATLPIKQAFKDIFPPKTGEDLVRITKGLESFTDSLKVSKPVADTMHSVFKVLFGVISIGLQAISGLRKAGNYLVKSLLDITGSMNGVIKPISDFITKLKESNTVGKLSEQIGMNIANVIIVLANIMLGAVKTIGIFYDSLKKIGIIDAITKGLEILNSKVLALVDSVKNLSSGFNGDFLNIKKIDLTKISESLQNLKENMSGPAKVVKNIFNSIGDSIKIFIGTIGKALKNADYNNLMDLLVKGIFGGVFVGVGKGVMGLLDEAENFVGGISGLLGSVKGVLASYQKDLNASSLLKISGAIAILAGALFVLSTINASKLTSSTIAMSALFANLFGSMALFNNTVGSKGVFTMSSMALALVGISTAVLILTIALKKLSSLDPAEITDGVLGLAAISTILVKSFEQLDKLNGGLIKKTIALNLFATSVLILVGVIRRIGELDISNIVKGLVGLTAIMGALVLFTKSADLGKISFSTGLGMMALAGAIYILSASVDKLGSIDIDKLAKGLGSLGVILLALAGFMKLMKDPSHMISIGLGMIALSVALLIISKSIEKIGNLKLEQIAKGLIGIGSSLAIIVYAMTKMPATTLVNATSIVLIAIALGKIAEALEVMGGQTVGQMAKGLITLGGSLTIIAVAMKYMAGALPGAAALVVVAASLAILVPVIIKMGELDWITIIKGLTALAGIFVILGVAGAVLTPLVPSLLALGAASALIGVGALAAGVGITLFATGLLALCGAAAAVSSTMSTIVDNVIKIGTAIVKTFAIGITELIKIIGDKSPEILGAFQKLFTEFLEVMRKVIPKLTTLMWELITSFLITVEQNLPSIIQSGWSILLAFLQGIRDNIGEIVSTAVDIVLNFIKGITSKMTDIVNAGVDMMISFINGLADAAEKRGPELVEAGINLMEGLIRGMLKTFSNITERFSNIGEEIVNGLKQGISNKAGEAKDAIVDTASGVFNAAKKFLDINSPSGLFEWIGEMTGGGFANGVMFATPKVIKASEEMSEKAYMAAMKKKKYGYKEAGKDNAEDLAKGIEQGTPKVAKAAGTMAKTAFQKSKEYIDERKAYNEMSLLEELNAWKDIQSQYNEGTEERKQADLKVYQLKKSFTEKMKAIDDDYYSSLDSLRTKAQEDIKAVNDSYNEAIKSRTEAIYNAYGLFDKLEQPELIKGSDLTANLAEQVAALKDWRKDITELSKRGLGEDLIDELREMGPDSADQIKALNKMTDDELSKYGVLWEEKYQQARYQANIELEGMKADNKIKIGEIITQVSKDAISLKNTWSEKLAEITGTNKAELINIRATWDKQIKTLNSEATKNFTDVKRSISGIGWNDLGKSITNGISSGVESGRSRLIRTTVSVALNAYKSAKKALDINSPSKKFAELGKYSVDGMVKGLTDNAHKAGMAGKEVANTSLSVMQNAIKKVGDMIDGGLDTTPVIRPVIDMSAVKSGISSTNDLLTTGITTVSAKSNVSTITDEAVRTKSYDPVRETVGIVDKLKQIISDNTPSMDLSGTLKVQVVNDQGNIIGITETAIKDILRRESR